MEPILHPTSPPHRQRIVRTVKIREEMIDHQVEATFPASDPPSYAGGRHHSDAPLSTNKEKREGRRKKK